MELVAYRVAMAVESRWLRAVDQRRRAWMAYLAEASELLGQSLSVELAVAVVPQVVVPRLGRWCAVYLSDAGTPRLAALTHADEDELPELRAALDPDARPGPAPELRAVLDSGRAPEAAPVRIATPTDGLAVPLRSRGATIGTLLVGRPDGRPHAPEDVVLVADIARRAALAVQNAQSAAAHVAVSQALQQALLPARAAHGGRASTSPSEYLPASRGTDVGGDFYDVLTVDGGRFLVSIGDVCGKGARAAARTGLVRDVLRVLVRGGRGLAEAVELLNEVMMEAADPLQFCTLAAALVRRDGEGSGGLAVELLLAGHERPVLVRADGRVEQVGAYGTAVGLLPRCWSRSPPTGSARATRCCSTPTASPSDGAARSSSGPNGCSRLAARTAGRPARQVVATVRDAVERFSPDPATDDVALLAVRALPE